MLSRRQSLQLSALGVAAGVSTLRGLGEARAAEDQGADTPRLPPAGPPTLPWLERLPMPQVKETVASLNPPPGEYPAEGEAGRLPHQTWSGQAPRKQYEIHVKEALHSFHPHLPTQTIWGYDGIFPGPCIVAKYNQPVLVRFHNELNPYATGFGSPEISVHLHNLHCAAESDGFAGDYWGSLRHGPGLTRAGNFKDHAFMNRFPGFSTDPNGRGDWREALGTLWYHDHRLDFTEQNVYRGMVGTYLLFDARDSGDEHDTRPAALRLPSGVGR
jgi:FtsP/CotA-like multicopper oxidase with cupredoxin domain